MNNIHGINSYIGPRAVEQSPASGTKNTQNTPTPSKKTDQVEISQIAHYLSRIAALPEIRTEKVESLRQALVEGNYDVDAKLSTALDRLLEEYRIE